MRVSIGTQNFGFFMGYVSKLVSLYHIFHKIAIQICISFCFFAVFFIIAEAGEGEVKKSCFF